MTEPAFAVRGMGYDAGVRYEHDFDSRPVWDVAAVRHDLQAIRHRLGCTWVLVMATELERLVQTARMAREEGLGVWLQPRLFEGNRAEVAENLAVVATAAEELRSEFSWVALNVGCELSLSTRGFLPGRTFHQRGVLLPFTAVLLPLANWRLRRFLTELAAIARSHFGGPVSYGAGDWEHPDWSAFDVVGLDAYRDAANAWSFADGIRKQVARHHAAGRPVYVFEFGSCTYRGASANASMASDVIKEDREGRMTVPESVERDEQDQSDYLGEMFAEFAGAGVDGTFVWGFSEPTLTHSTQPGADLDRASYGIVAVRPDGSWVPKFAFHTVATQYGGTG
ncbi:MAG: hypothetical protein ACTH2Q_01730 [Propionibacteriaceae bacterium]